MTLLRKLALSIVAAGLATSFAAPSHAFPPYRSTDAGTADPYDLEVRLGLGQLQRKAGDTEVSSPQLRVNFGLPGDIEINSEFDYSPRADAFDDGALGIKWIPVGGPVRVGMETLLLLPVNQGMSGFGVESQVLTTLTHGSSVIHVNAGGFHDPRSTETESGWRASMLAEFERGSFRPGFEIAAKDSNRGRTDVRAGAGVIARFGRFDVRPGVHVGLTAGAPDIVASLWIATKFQLR